MAIQTHDYTIRALIDAELKFKIPDLQRGYVWTEREAMQLIRSIEKHMNLNLDMYLGTTLFFKGGGAYNEVIDGQQRITTISMLFRIIIDWTKNYCNDIDTWKKEELKVSLRVFGKTIGGTKPELRERLRDATTELTSIMDKFLWDESGTKPKRRISHNTTPNKQNYLKVLSHHTEYFQRMTESIEKRDEYESSKANYTEKGQEQRYLKTSGATEAELVQIKEERLLAKEKRNNLKAECKATEDAAEIQWERRLEKRAFIGESYGAMSNWFRLTVADNPNHIVKLMNWVLDRVEIVTITVKDRKQTHLIFKSLNAFGKLLTISEKTKNELLSMGVMVGIEGNVKAEWDLLIEQLKQVKNINKPDLVSDLLWTYAKSNGWTQPPTAEKDGRTSKTLKRQLTYHVFDDPKGIFDIECKNKIAEGEYETNETKLIAFITKLKHWAHGYRVVQDPTLLKHKGVNPEWVNEISDIRTLMPEQTRPYILASYMKTLGQGGNNNITDFQKLIKCLSVVLVRLICTETIKPNKLESHLQDWTNIISERDVSDAIDEIKELVKLRIENYLEIASNTALVGSRNWNTAVDDRFEQSLIGNNNFENKHAKYLLRGCEGIERWAGNRELLHDYHLTKFYTAEHIAPDSEVTKFSNGINSNWRHEHDALPTLSKPWPEQLINGNNLSSAEVYRHYKRKLGNFLILEKLVNIKCSTRTWRGTPVETGWKPKPEPDWDAATRATFATGQTRPMPAVEEFISRGVNVAERPTEDGKHWGKYHIIAHGEWEYGEPVQKLRGSRLKSAKIFLKKYKAELGWSAQLIDDRTAELAGIAKKRKNWKFW